MAEDLDWGKTLRRGDIIWHATGKERACSRFSRDFALVRMSLAAGIDRGDLLVSLLMNLEHFQSSQPRCTEESFVNEPSTAFCPHCGAAVNLPSTFCGACGQPLQNPAPPCPPL